MSDIKDLYRELIVDHSKSPRNFGLLENANKVAEGFNPLCGDKVTLYLQIENDKVAKAMFKGSGCAISTASASLLTESIQGKSLTECEGLFDKMQRLLTGDKNIASTLPPKLSAFSGVAEFPARVKCAVLSWHVLHNLVRGKKEIATTE